MKFDDQTMKFDSQIDSRNYLTEPKTLFLTTLNNEREGKMVSPLRMVASV